VGYAFIGLALFGFAAGTLYQKRFGQTVDLRSGTAIQLLGATVASFPFAAAHGGLALPLTTSAVGSVVWLGTVNSIGSFILLFMLLRRRSGGAATSLLYLVPPVTALLGIPLLGQSVGVTVLLGMAVSGVGVLLVIVRERSRTRKKLVRDDPAPDHDPQPTVAQARRR
ncbi:MAG: DMT family transporter, partial [Rubrobacteraceae bacterium]